MNRKEFMSELKRNLKGLSKEDREEIIQDYEDHFSIGKKKKRKESEIAKALGSPKQIAKQAKLELLISNAEKDKSIKNIGRVIFAAIGLSFFNLIFILGPFVGLLSVLISLFAVGFSLGISGIAVVIAGIIPGILSNLIQISGITNLLIVLVGLILFSIGSLFLIGTWYLSKGFYILTIKYVKLNVRIIRQ